MAAEEFERKDKLRRDCFFSSFPLSVLVSVGVVVVVVGFVESSPPEATNLSWFSFACCCCGVGGKRYTETMEASSGGNNSARSFRDRAEDAEKENEREKGKSE
jgi:hypothetical protein